MIIFVLKVCFHKHVTSCIHPIGRSENSDLSANNFTMAVCENLLNQDFGQILVTEFVQS